MVCLCWTQAGEKASDSGTFPGMLGSINMWLVKKMSPTLHCTKDIHLSEKHRLTGFLGRRKMELEKG